MDFMTNSVSQMDLLRLPETMRQRTHHESKYQHPSPSQTPRLALSVEEVAEVLGISRAHVWRLHSSGHIPRPVRLGRSVRWDRKTLEAWLEAGGPPRDRWESMRQP